ncbi:MAG: hypothetical protein ACM3JG_15435 [Thiohalocapsa sp.]
MAGVSLGALLIASPPLARQPSAQTRLPAARPAVPIIPPAAAPAQPAQPAAAPSTPAPQTATGLRHDRPTPAMHRGHHHEGWRRQARHRRGSYRYRRHHRDWAGGAGDRVAGQLNAAELYRVTAPPVPPR